VQYYIINMKTVCQFHIVRERTGSALSILSAVHSDTRFESIRRFVLG